MLFIWYYFSLPTVLFHAPTSTVVESAEGELIGAQIAGDGQWRFPPIDSIPKKFETALLSFEDAYFYQHIGFNPVSIAKAFYENLRAGSVQRGGSTLTQQVIRLSRKQAKRSYFEKFKELILATRLELRLTKKEILKLYASHAPFGGNVVGLDMASYRYFGRPPFQLSWAESATLAVLPNAPSLIYPGKNQQKLKVKRDRLLYKLFREGAIDSLTYQLSIAEELPQKPFPIPQLAAHLLQRFVKTDQGKRIRSTVQYALQKRAQEIVKQHYHTLKQNHIYNAAVLIMEVRTKKIIAYIGNTPTDKQHQKDVDIIEKPRSTGSILKPFLYTAMLDAGDILPNMLVADVPTQIASYTPQNFDLQFSGAVAASRALSRSLNVPAVRMLQQFGLDRFYHYLKALKLRDVKYDANHYGLSLILGGAESNLWDLTKSYASLSSTLNHYDSTQGKYYTKEFGEPRLREHSSLDMGEISTEKTLFDAGSIYLTFNALKEVNRPEGNENWEFFDSSRKIAWKTGTSFGFRDAWAIGTTKDYTIGVWVGNADGEGRPGLVGISTAAPLMFDLFQLLPRSEWFKQPFDEMEEVPICALSGYRAGQNCTTVDTVFVQRSGLKTKACSYHIWVHLDSNEEFQVNSSCYPTDQMVHKSWFVLPPLQAYYYQQNHPDYRVLPNFQPNCSGGSNATMDFIYPKEDLKIVLARDFSEDTNEIVLKIAHDLKDSTIFWYLDANFIGATQTFHEMAVIPKKGKHRITATDEFGNQIFRDIEIVD
ncbi:penicillin-binding protein 1C [Flavobacteriaceae bacterium F08102]|nr:penicillin-binding protein 1C [Flavobacteriaceae bacterium F08102]